MNMHKIHKNMKSLSDNELHIFVKKMTEPFKNIFVPSKVYVIIFKNLVLNKKKVFASLLVLALNIKLSLPPC